MSYRRRLQVRRQRLAERREREQADTLTYRESIMRAYEEAYTAVHGRTPKVVYRHGWYRVGGRNLRELDFEIETRILTAQADNLARSEFIQKGLDNK